MQQNYCRTRFKAALYVKAVVFEIHGQGWLGV
jgi:hypothetical protein